MVVAAPVALEAAGAAPAGLVSDLPVPNCPAIKICAAVDNCDFSCSLRDFICACASFPDAGAADDDWVFALLESGLEVCDCVESTPRSGLLATATCGAAVLCTLTRKIPWQTGESPMLMPRK